MKARRRLPILLIFILVAAVSLPLVASERPQPKPVVDFIAESDALIFKPLQEVERLHLRVTNPDGLTIDRIFKAGGGMFTMGELIDEVRELSLEGCYTWEVRGVPILTQEEEEILNNGRDLGRPAPIWLQVKLESLLQSGTFSVSRGTFVYDDVQETDIDGKLRAESADLARQGDSGTELGPVLGPVSAVRSEELPLDPQFDFLINDDLIVIGSACIGFDCVNGEVFSFDTIRLKENNLRIKFDDTSSAAGFPNTDWQLTANDSASGGIGKFSIEDISGARVPFTIEAGAPSNSLYVDNSGRIGRRTSNPVLELHLVDGDSPALRLEQDGSSGFQPQTWDIAGNETNFFVRDATNGSTLPFRIRPGAPSSSLFIDTGGAVGVGTSSPDGLQVNRTVAETARNIDNVRMGVAAGTPRIILEDNGASQWQIDNLGGTFRWFQSGSVRMIIDTAGKIGFGVSTVAAANSIEHSNGARLTTGGVWADASSREYKENIQSLASDEAIDALAQLAPVIYQYKKSPEERYVGFIAEEVPELVAMEDRKSLAPMEIVAVLTKVVQEQQKTIDDLIKTVEKLKEVNAQE